MLERFQHDARAVVGHAREEAARLGRRAVGTEHLLLGLLARPGHAADALKAAGADAESLRANLTGADAAPAPAQPVTAAGLSASPPVQAEPVQAETVRAQGAPGPQGGAGVAASVPLTENASRAVEVAVQEAQRLDAQHVSSEHLLLGIIDQPGSQAVRMLKIGGIQVGMLRADLLRRLESGHNPYPK